MTESSTYLMTHVVQDLLDFAQIKANKFRKNFKKFDIREAINKIMSYQNIKA
jgi:signal transduction histidine kinase